MDGLEWMLVLSIVALALSGVWLGFLIGYRIAFDKGYNQAANAYRNIIDRDGL